MSCCGKKRDALRQRRIMQVAEISEPSPPTEGTSVVFRGSGAYLIAGQYSRRVYHFTSELAEQRVDTRDVAAMLRTGFFEVRA